jgi:D-apionate oxidoisomerase
MGAGGKMGFRVTKKLHDAGHDVRAIETDGAGRTRLAEAGIAPTGQKTGLAGADVVVMALPDSLIGQVTHAIAPDLASGTMVLILDAAAPYAGALPQRPDLTYFIGHPCHPPLYSTETEGAERTDYHGGIAPQAIVCALMQGPEAHYEIGAEVCRTMWSPVTRTHRVTLEQLAILEPGLSEMVGLTLIDAMAGAVDECAARYGIAREAAHDFMMGHMNVLIAMWFGVSPKVPSDAALRVTRHAQPLVLNPDWRQALSPAAVLEGSRLIVEGRGRP